jgi:hypothetical protein
MQQQSVQMMRRVCTLARSFRMPERLHITTHPHVSPTEYVRLGAMAAIPEAGLDALIDDFHAQHADHSFPVSLLDPMERVGRWP